MKIIPILKLQPTAMKKPVSLGALFLFTFLLFAFQAHAQQTGGKKNPFIRVYSLEGKKIAKGRITGGSETGITLQRGKKTEIIDIGKVGFIRSKHSVGNNVLVGAVAGSAIAAATFAAAADPDIWIFGYTAADGLLAGLILGAPLGGSIGALTALFKRSERYDIHGQAKNWLAVRDAFLK
jgi:hypothetical protein